VFSNRHMFTCNCLYTCKILICDNTKREIFSHVLLYENIVDQILTNKYHGPMHYKIGDRCVYNGQVFYVVITRQSNLSISQFNSPCNEFISVWSIFVYNTQGEFWTFTDSPVPILPFITSYMARENVHVKVGDQ